MPHKYLGDAVYIRTKNGGYELYTTNGVVETNHIFLEPEVAISLIEAIKQDMAVK